MIDRRWIGAGYLILGTPIAFLLDVRAVWANIQASPLLWLWAASLVLTLSGIALTIAPRGDDRLRRLGWYLEAAALVVLTPHFLIGYLGVASWYHLAVGLIVFRPGEDVDIPFASVTLLAACNLFLLSLPAMTRPQPAPVVFSIGYPLYVAPLGSLALIWAAYIAFDRI